MRACDLKNFPLELGRRRRRRRKNEFDARESRFLSRKSRKTKKRTDTRAIFAFRGGERENEAPEREKFQTRAREREAIFYTRARGVLEELATYIYTHTHKQTHERTRDSFFYRSFALFLLHKRERERGRAQ